MPFPIRIDATTLPALIFGAILIVTAVGMGILVWRTRRALESLLQDDDDARRHADRQFRRRVQISIMLAVVGILIPLGDQLDQVFIKRPLLFVGWVACVFGLVFWMVLMALGDWMSTMAYSSIAKARLRFERRELEAEIRRYHANQNGHSPGPADDSV